MGDSQGGLEMLGTPKVRPSLQDSNQWIGIPPDRRGTDLRALRTGRRFARRRHQGRSRACFRGSACARPRRHRRRAGPSGWRSPICRVPSGPPDGRPMRRVLVSGALTLLAVMLATGWQLRSQDYPQP
jgi:hypothetical protein